MAELTEEQKSAIKKLVEWYFDSKKEPFITLGGYAGTGKTTLIAVLRKLLFKYKPSLNIAICSYTGRATQILRTRLEQSAALQRKDSISTIHGLIYAPEIGYNEEITGWAPKDSIPFDLIIVDEASMVDEAIWSDLLYYKIPIIAVGDHGQLPPIQGSFNLMADPQIKLEKIHRQAEDNPIIKVSMMARKDGKIKIKKYSKNVIKYDIHDYESEEILHEKLESLSDDSLVLTGYNKSRVEINNLIRTKKLFETPEPETRDRVICLKNNHIKGIYNGMLGTITHINKEDEKWFYATINLDDGLHYSGLVFAPQFNAKNSLNFTDQRKILKTGDLFDFGYAITVHKAQGSETEKLILLEERNKHMSDDVWARWLYTAVTRAKTYLYIFGE